MGLKDFVTEIEMGGGEGWGVKHKTQSHVFKKEKKRRKMERLTCRADGQCFPLVVLASR